MLRASAAGRSPAAGSGGGERGGARVAPLEEVAEGAQARADVLQHRHPGRPQAGAALGWIALETPHTTANGLSVEAQTLSAAQAWFRWASSLWRSTTYANAPVSGSWTRWREQSEKDVVGVVAGPPGVQGVDGRQSGLQPRGDAAQGLLRGPGERERRGRTRRRPGEPARRRSRGSRRAPQGPLASPIPGAPADPPSRSASRRASPRRRRTAPRRRRRPRPGRPSEP